MVLSHCFVRPHNNVMMRSTHQSFIPTLSTAIVLCTRGSVAGALAIMLLPLITFLQVMGPVDGDPLNLRCNSAQALLKTLLVIGKSSLIDIHNQYLGCKWPQCRSHSGGDVEWDMLASDYTSASYQCRLKNFLDQKDMNSVVCNGK